MLKKIWSFPQKKIIFHFFRIQTLKITNLYKTIHYNLILVKIAIKFSEENKIMKQSLRII